MHMNISILNYLLTDWNLQLAYMPSPFTHPLFSSYWMNKLANTNDVQSMLSTYIDINFSTVS